jgi:hypothetical protein
VATNYPGALDSLTNPTVSSYEDDAGVFHDEQHANANDAIEAIEAELGTDPAGAQATVKERLVYGQQHLGLEGVAVWKSTDYVVNGVNGATVTTITRAADGIYYYPWWCPFDVTIDRIAVEVTTNQTGGLARLGLYAAGSDGAPSTLVVDAGEIDTSATGVKELTISQALTGGTLYWLVIANKTANVAYRAIASAGARSLGNLPNSTTNSVPTNVYESKTYAALAGTATAWASMTGVNSQAPVMFWIRRS